MPHAFGGAIALAYCTLEPRGTIDIDCNVFVPAGAAGPALAALPAEVARPEVVDEIVARDGQVRLWWDEVPLDLFFDYAPIHADAAAHARTVEFQGEQIPVLGPLELVVFKAMFDRTRDWADIEAVFEAGEANPTQVRRVLASLLDRDDARLARVTDAARRAGADPD